MKPSRPLHRGAPHDPAKFAPAFVRGRLGGFKKDIQICLTGIPSTVRPGLTHAYFPALATCCATLEYLSGLYLGQLKGLKYQHVIKYALRFLPQPAYDKDMIRVLFDAFRNGVAHRGIASGVWIDEHPRTRGRRFTWKVYALDEGAALEVLPDEGQITKDPPWSCRYTHRVHIRLGQLAKDICASADMYLDALVADRALQDKFMRCMEYLYPR
jgi:hypothetical protein